MTSRNLSQSRGQLTVTPQPAPDDSPPPVLPSASEDSAGLPPLLAPSSSSSSTGPPQPSRRPNSAASAESPGDGHAAPHGLLSAYDEPNELEGRQGSEGLSLSTGARDDSGCEDRGERPGAAATAALPRAAHRTARGEEGGMPARAPIVAPHPASEEDKLRVFQEKLASDEATVREVVVILSRPFPTSTLLNLLGKQYRGYLLAKLNFDGGDILSKDLEKVRESKELKQLTDRSKQWMEKDRLTAEEMKPECVLVNFVDFIMDALKVVSTNVHALRIFTGFFVHIHYSLSESNTGACIQVLVDLKIVATRDAIREATQRRHVVNCLKFLMLHLALDRLYGSDVGSSTVNLRCCLRAEGIKNAKEVDTNEGFRHMMDDPPIDMDGWCWLDRLSSHLLGCDRVPGCEAIHGKSSIRAPCSIQEWKEALQAASNYLKSRGRVANGYVDDTAARAPPGETIAHFVALAKRREPTGDDTLLTVIRLFTEGASRLEKYGSSNDPELVPWRTQALHYVQGIADVVNQSGCSRAPTTIAVQARDFSGYPAAVMEIFPAALGFVMHSPKFLEWTKEYLKNPRANELAETAIAALNIAVSEAELGAHTGDIDPLFSGRMIMLDSLRAFNVLDTGRIKTRDDGSFSALVWGASRECPQYRLVMKFEVMLHEEDLVQRFFPSLFCMSALSSCPNVARLYSYDSFTVPPQSIHCTDGETEFTREAEFHVGTVLFMEAGGDTLRDELDKRAKQKATVKELIIESLRNVLQILNGLVALHKLNREHRAIKPENVVRGHHGQLQLMDLGLCLLMKTARQRQFGTSMYGYARDYFPPTPKGFFDVFSVGVILHESICGYRPDQSRKRLHRPVEKEIVKRMFMVAESADGKEVIALSKDMLKGKYNAEDAATAVEMLLREFEKKFEAARARNRGG